nr:unnamed protein product [Naegleria fowleri]
MNERNMTRMGNPPSYLSMSRGEFDITKYSKDSNPMEKNNSTHYSRASPMSSGDASSNIRSSQSFSQNYSSASVSSPVRSSITKTPLYQHYLSSPKEKYSSKSLTSTPSFQSSGSNFRASTPSSTRTVSTANSQSPSTSIPPYSSQAFYDNKNFVSPLKKKEEPLSKRTPISFKRLEFSAMNRNAKFIDRCIIISSEKDYLTYGMKTSALSICLEMGIQLLHKVIDVMSLKKISSSMIDEVLKIGSLQDPQQGYLNVDGLLQLNERFKQALTECYSINLETKEIEKTSLVIEKIQMKRKKNVLTILQQKGFSIAIFSIVEHEMEDVIHVIFDPSTQTTSGILHGASFLLVTGIGFTEYLNDWLLFSDEESINCSFFIRNENNVFKRFSFTDDEENRKEINSPSVMSTYEEEKRLSKDLMQKLELQRNIIDRLEQEIRSKESSLLQEQAKHSKFLEQEQALMQIRQILKGVQ